MKAPAVSIPEEYTKNPLRQMPEGTNQIRGTTLILQISLQRLRTSYVFPVYLLHTCCRLSEIPYGIRRCSLLWILVLYHINLLFL